MRRDRRSSGVLCDLDWQLVNAVWGQRVSSLKMGSTRCHDTTVANCQSAMGNIAEERRSHLHCVGMLKPRIFVRSFANLTIKNAWSGSDVCVCVCVSACVCICMCECMCVVFVYMCV